MTAHYSRSPYVRDAGGGAVEKRSASLRLRLEPTLLALAKLAADDDRTDRYRDWRGPGVAAYVRGLIVEDLRRRGWLDRDGSPRGPGAMCGNTSDRTDPAIEAK